MRKVKTGRRANDSERRLAQQVVDLYRKAQGAPDGMLPVESDHLEAGEGLFFDSNDPSEALAALENFAKYGTFECVDMESVNLLMLNLDYDELIESGLNYSDAIHELAEKRNVSTRSIERYLAKGLVPLSGHSSSVKIVKK